MTSMERMHTLFEAVNYIEKNKIEGDYVECGVWKGGSSMMAAMAFVQNNSFDRTLYLYDTFQGMSEPSDKDISIKGQKMMESWKQIKTGDKIFCYSSLDEVKSNINKTNYPLDKIKYIEGKVETTIPELIPEKIAILRLDTDWYESTYHEMVHLYPLLTEKGVLIIDDYGHWKGAREAVDQYFSENNIKTFMHRIDYTGRVIVKTS